MLTYLSTLVNLKNDRRAVTALEYGLIAGLIAAVIVAAVGLVGTNLTTTFNTVASSV